MDTLEKMGCELKQSGQFLEGDQDIPHQNMPLWHKTYYKLKAIKNQQIKERFIFPPFICLKSGHKFPFVKVVFISPISCTRMRKQHLSQEMKSYINKPYWDNSYLSFLEAQKPHFCWREHKSHHFFEFHFFPVNSRAYKNINNFVLLSSIFFLLV